MKITVVDYGVGNLKSLQNALRYLGYETELVSRPEELVAANKIILPGVGAFGYAMNNIKKLALDSVLADNVRVGTPILGICLGMQLLFSGSEEGGNCVGLDLIQGQVKQLTCRLKIPHIGWNEVRVRQTCALTRGLPESRFAYFVHSYVCVPDDSSVTAACTDYGDEFVSVVAHENVFGTQFHPEKSQDFGLRILRNFAEV